ncbi:MAG TPA: molybdenum cofactor guanylyltransferase [Methylophaga aminisulfidivorans]|uniref:Molybdenum cofactor guanylyltransferase n=3 Tax=root TaxID=1 RepID=A0A7C2AN92_9GAMM|nr:molybdenum cofactor guanylyltransferase [Methylophaga aminisulfidivorans]
MNITFPITVSGVLLAGGQSRRMGGKDKGLIIHNGSPLIEQVIHSILPQTDQLLISANRHIEEYQAFGYPVITDNLDDFQGPLAGMLSAMESATTDYILTAPCDCPVISAQLRQRLMEGLLATGADIAVAHDGHRLQPVFALIPVRLKTNLRDFLASGERKTQDWFEKQMLSIVDFSDQTDSFVNLNTPEDFEKKIPIASSKPILGFAAYSGTGKTTLLTKLIPILNQRGIRIAVIKHAHHNFDIDTPGKDSYMLREAGAQQMLIASSRMMALMQKNHAKAIEPKLQTLLRRLDTKSLDLILVEGFKHERYPKIELNRHELGKAELYKADADIIAIATDQLDIHQHSLPILDINNIGMMADFIEHYLNKWNAEHG